jgi:hypothetical protein
MANPPLGGEEGMAGRDERNIIDQPKAAAPWPAHRSLMHTRLLLNPAAHEDNSRVVTFVLTFRTILTRFPVFSVKVTYSFPRYVAQLI